VRTVWQTLICTSYQDTREQVTGWQIDIKTSLLASRGFLNIPGFKAFVADFSTDFRPSSDG
jgi:hypothetical protein